MGVPKSIDATSMAGEISSIIFWRDVIAELVATFFLVSIQCALPLAWGYPNTGSAVQVNYTQVQYTWQMLIKSLL